MAKTYNKMLLDINEKPSDIITAVQNDTNSRYLDVLLYDNGTPIDLTGCEVKIFMEKPEKGGEVWNDGIITDAENGRCEFLLTTEALTHFGHLQVQISIWKDNTEILSTQIFEIIVTKSLVGNSSVEASNEYGTLVILFQNLYEAYDLMTRMVQNIGVPAEVAAQYDLATMWQAWEFLVAYMKGDFTDKVDEAIANASVQGVLDILGLTGDTGGSTTAGTTMAKLNAMFGDFQEILNNIDVARQYICKPSSKVLATFFATEHSQTGTTELEVGEHFVIYNATGLLQFNASLKGSVNSYDACAHLRVKHLDGTVETYKASVCSTSYKTVSVTNVKVQHGDELYVLIKFINGSNNIAYCNLATLSGDITVSPLTVGAVKV